MMVGEGSGFVQILGQANDFQRRAKSLCETADFFVFKHNFGARASKSRDVGSDDN